MKFFISKSQFVAAIQSVSKAVTGKSSMQVLSGIKIVAESDGLRLVATDLEIGIETTIPLEVNGEEVVKIHKKGSVVLAARFLGEIVRKVPSDWIEVDKGDNFATTLRSGSAEYHLHGMDPEEFPRLPQLEGDQIFSIPQALFKTMIRDTTFAVSTEQIRPVLTGVLWRITDGLLQFVATDSHRLAMRSAAIEAAGDLQLNNVVVPAKSMNEIARLLSDDDRLIDVLVTEKQLLVSIDNTQFYSRLINGQFPDISRIIPTNCKTSIEVDTKNLLHTIDRAALIARENDNTVRVSIDSESMEITSFSAEVGKVQEELVPASFHGDPLQIAFNSKFMIDALKVIDAPHVLLEFTGAMSPFLVKIPADSNVLHLILPMRTN